MQQYSCMAMQLLGHAVLDQLHGDCSVERVGIRAGEDDYRPFGRELLDFLRRDLHPFAVAVAGHPDGETTSLTRLHGGLHIIRAMHSQRMDLCDHLKTAT
jgi:hypothetical protein